MKLSRISMLTLVAVAVVLMTPLISVSNAATSTLTATEKTPLFLSNVLGVDLANYEKIQDSSRLSFPSTGVQEESEGFEYKASNGSDIQGMAIYDNQYIKAIVFSINGTLTLSNQYMTDILSLAHGILARYGTFSQACSINSPCLSSATAMLAQVHALAISNATSNATSGNVKMNLLCSNLSSNNSTQISWVYTANNVDAQSKRLSLTLTQLQGSFQVSFVDTWGLYSVAGTGISQEEAVNIAWQAAQNFRFVFPNSTSTVVPSFANGRYDVGLIMVPGDTFNSSSVKSSLNWSSGGISKRSFDTLSTLESRLLPQ